MSIRIYDAQRSEMSCQIMIDIDSQTMAYHLSHQITGNVSNCSVTFSEGVLIPTTHKHDVFFSFFVHKRVIMNLHICYITKRDWLVLLSYFFLSFNEVITHGPYHVNNEDLLSMEWFRDLHTT